MLTYASIQESVAAAQEVLRERESEIEQLEKEVQVQFTTACYLLYWYKSTNTDAGGAGRARQYMSILKYVSLYYYSITILLY
jgi:hypothetical protein